MIYKERFIELWVNGNKVELESQKSISIRFNNVLFDPTKISSTQAEYSFEFEVPCTPKNNVIFDYSNNLSKTNKFHQRYNAEVYADGTVIFSGTITVNGVKENKYSLNLVSVKVYSLDEIFGDMTMDKIKNWKVDFNGVESINSYNNSDNPDVCFPFVSYGAFQKKPYNADEVGKEYTSKFDIDQYNRWYVESFPPSHNMLKTLRKAFESVDYKVGGDVFNNPYLKNVYMSVNLADGQSPIYNLGNPKFGKVQMSVSWTADGAGYVQDLKYPYYKIGGYADLSQQEPITVDPDYNFKAVQLYDMLSSGNVNLSSQSYMYQPDEHVIVIPADGFYEIDMTMNSTLGTDTPITASQFVREWNDDVGALDLRTEEKDISFNPDFATTTPLEIQLVRNYDDNIELIKGKYNMAFQDGYPDHTTQGDKGRTTNYNNSLTCFPHEKLGSFYWFFGVPTDGGELVSSKDFWTKDSSIGYMPKDTAIMAYDQAVSPTFICGFTSMGNKDGAGCPSVMKNGYSWSKISSEKNEAMYDQTGYQKVDIDTTTYASYYYTNTTYNSNTYPLAPLTTFYSGGRLMRGEIHTLVHLKKNDVLQLYAVHRDYNTTGGTQVTYQTTANINLTIQAISPDSYINLRARNYNYLSPVEFDTQLNLANFFNKEKKISEWVQNIADAFNLDIIQSGKNVIINTKKKINTNVISTVEIDDRVNSANAESKAIDYPKSMAVKYKIDADEWGFERSAVESQGGDESILNNDDWKKYGDSGFSVVQLNDDSYATSTSDKNLQFSYTWYQNFNWYAVNSEFIKTSDTPVTIRIPCISKYTYMIDGYDYDESMKHDGYGQPQRFWFKAAQASWATNQYVWTRTYPAEMVWLYTPSNVITNYRDLYFNLSYKSTENSLLTEFFNINAYLASNYVELEVYLSADEYDRIKNGSLIHFDSDLYIPVSIEGYDPSGINPTTLKMMKKVV